MKENEQFPIVCSRSPQNLEFGHFTFVCCFAEDGEEMYQTLKKHVQSDCFCSLRPSNTGNFFFQLVAQECCSCKFRLFVARITSPPATNFHVAESIDDMGAMFLLFAT